jgi:hypothetical protein
VLPTTGYALSDGDTIQPEHFDQQMDSSGASQADSAEDLYQPPPVVHEVVRVPVDEEGREMEAP